MTESADVLIVGGGPAGSATAIRLAAAGRNVCVVEAEPFPRPHVGESLTPAVLPLLESLGVRADVEAAGFLRPWGALIRWGGTGWVRPPHAGPAGFQVDRARFDALLLEAAAHAGARVLHPARAGNPVRSDQGWRVPVSGPDGDRVVSAKMLVDAAGRSGLLPGGRRRLAPATLAVYAYWLGVGWDGPETRIDVGPDQWYWGAPLPDGTTNATVFVAPDRLRRSSGPAELYPELLVESDLFAECLRGRLAGPVRVCASAPVAADEPIGDGWVKVGEAAVALDPLSSQGVQTALAGGIQAAAVVHTLLTNPASRAAVAFYRNRVGELVAQHAATAAEYYRLQAQVRPTPFWLARAAPAPPLEPPAPVQAAPAPTPTTRVEWAAGVVVDEPVLVGSEILTALAVRAPGSARAVAFLGGVPLADIVPLLDDRPTIDDLAHRLAARYGRPLAAELLDRLIESGALRPAAG